MLKENIVLKKFGAYNLHAIFKKSDGYKEGDVLSFDVPSSTDKSVSATKADVESIAREIAEEVFEEKSRGFR